MGFDFHPFSAGRRLLLGGVEIPFERGLEGHSDADALLHAVTDAILGGAGLTDIGTHFPDSDPRFRDISSQVLLEEALSLVRERGLRVGNVDIVVVAQAPKIQPYVVRMKDNVARLLKIQPADVGVKATTMEGRGVIGRGEGIAVQAVVLLHPADPASSKPSRKLESDG
jgi:2-C-methyl-D-erythritol 2,4-cyclodiphosphate synthase